MKAFKGTDRNMQCRGFQFEQDKEYVHEGAVKACNSGFHSCEHPLDVFGYYPPSESRFFEVEASGDISTESSDTKVASSHIRFGMEIGIEGMIKAAVKFVFDKADWSKKETHSTGNQGAASATGNRGAASATGDQGAASATGNRGAASATGNRGAASATGNRGAASATGNRGAASATGYQGAASATGNRGAASATGKVSIACGLGVECTASGALGCWIVLAEREWNDDENVYEIKTVKTAKVDGKKIKPGVFYILKDGKFTEA